MQHGSQSSPADVHGSAAAQQVRADNASSLFNGIVGRFVQRRLSPVRSLSDIATTYIIRPRTQRQSSSSSTGSSSSSDIAPPPPYSEDPPSSDEDDMDADYESAPSSRPSTSSAGSTAPSTSIMTLTNADQTKFTDHLVRFKFANQGLLLVAQSAQELRTNPNASNEYQRRLYVDGVAYLLRALPEALTDTERACLQAALPPEIRQEDNITVETTIEHEQRGKADRRSLLAGVVSTIVFWIFFVAATALPYAKIMARWSLDFERKHRLGEQFLNRTLALLQITYSQLIALIYAVWAFNDGMIGQKLTELGVWSAEHVGDGIRDGLREAAAAIRRSQDES